jgi:acetyl-CoA acetyltransferase
MRTPFGDFSKSLKDGPLANLGIRATKTCLDKAGLKGDQVDNLVWGNVLPWTNTCARKMP